MWKFIRHEWKYWLGSPMTWIFLLINTLLILGAVSSDNISIGGGVGSVHKNAPYVVQTYYGVMSLVCLLMTTAFMNASANRDFSHGMYQFVFSSPIKKSAYYFGKFIGAATIAIIPLLGVSLGSLLGPLMPWAQPERYGEVVWSGHLLGLLTFGIPNTLIAAVLLYTLAILFRSNIVSFIGAMMILIFYAVSSGFTRDIEKEWLANLLDPFGFQPESIVAKYLTINEKNTHGVPLNGALLMNRLIWIGLSALILVLAYFKFSFTAKNEKVKKRKEVIRTERPLPIPMQVYKTKQSKRFSFRVLGYLILFETKAIIKNPTFIIIVVLGLMNLTASLTSFTGRYGVDQYPVTYDVVDAIKGSFYLFLVAIITFYTGVLVWKERDAKINEIQDATPVQSALLFGSKLGAMIISLVLILSCTILLGIIAQTALGYHRYQMDVYLKSLLLIDLLPFIFLTVMALFFHYLINNRYIAYFAFVAFVILNQFIWNVFEINTNMLKYGSTPSVTYSDMNGFGPFVPSLVWFNLYWSAFTVLLMLIIYAFFIRGKETGFRHRMIQAKNILAAKKITLMVCVFVFLSCAAFVFYNTKMLNTYDSQKVQEQKQVDYELKYKKYESIEQPRFYKYTYEIDLQPYTRSLQAVVEAWAINRSGKPIQELHFTMPQIPDSVKIDIAGATLKFLDKRLSYRIYHLEKPLMPKDTILIRLNILKRTKGFENEVSFTQLTQNGTFFNNRDIMPVFGYEKGNEITDKNKRLKMGLPKRLRMAKLNEYDFKSRANTYISNDADWVEVSTTISTTPDQIAIAPGSLIKSWEAGGKKYFKYQLDQKALDFYSFISAKYEVARRKWKGIDLEVYYAKEHAYNVSNMLKSLERSMEYYTSNFGPYYHKQCRIIEFPRYAGFAQAFPGTMPYSEGIGFITDLRKVTKEDIDLVFYVVAHEMGHQYWAHQICGPDMQGSEMMSEGFAQYSALMVMEKEYGRDRMKKFLKYEMDGYLRGRSLEFEAERPLMKTEHQSYIHYQKASVVMYYLKELIGENQVNKALHSLLDSFAYKPAPYPTSLSALRAFRKVTPDSLQQAVSDLFENITLFSNRTIKATSKKTGGGYEVTIQTSSEKFYADSLGKETNVLLSDYIDIGIFAEPIRKNNLGKPLLLKRYKVTQKDHVFVFQVKEKPYQAGIDPYNYLIDRLPDDNLMRIEQ